MKIAMISGEANPFSKTGGLGDVVYALSKELVKSENDVYIITPFYHTKAINNAKTKVVEESDIRMNWRHNKATFRQLDFEGIHYIFVENDSYFGRDNLYGYFDDGERFAFLSLSAMAFIEHKSFDIVHCHDWQTGMIPLLIKDYFKKKPKTVLTIHNPAFLGYFAKEQLFDFYNLSDKYFDDGSTRFNNMVSSLKSGIFYADKITTVSPTHRKELLSKEGGNGLDSILNLRKDDFVGIVNGIDVDEFSPLHDKLIKSKFSSKNIDEGKLEAKKDLFKTFNLPFTDGPVFGIVTRLTWQKGTSLVFQNADLILSRGGTLLVLGSGEKEQEYQLENLRSRYPDKVGIYIGYSNEIAHKIYAGSDFFLMPSLFEPCGISQMISHRYATIPIVRETGGLVDTVVGFDGKNESKANGVRFTNLDYGGLSYGINKAIEIYENKDLFNRLRLNSYKVNHSWKKSAEKYLEIYKKII